MIRKVGGVKHGYRTTYTAGVNYHREQLNQPRLISRAISAIPALLIKAGGLLRHFAVLLLAVAIHFRDKLFPRRDKPRARKAEAAIEAPATAYVPRRAALPAKAQPRDLLIGEPETFRGVTLRRTHTRRDSFTVVEAGFALRTGLIALGIALGLTLVVSVPAARVLLASKTVTLVDGSNPIEISSTAATIGQLMDEYGIHLSEGDIVYPARTSALEDDTRIQIRRAMSIDTISDGVARTLRIQAGTVRDALAIAGIPLHEDDIVDPPLNEKLAPGMTIGITRVVTETLTETERIHYREIVQEDKTLLVGNREISQKGKEGEKELEIEIVYHDGEEISREIVGERIIEAPVHRIVKEGTKTAAPKPTATAKKATATASASTDSKSSSKSYKVTKYAVTYDGKRYDIKDTDRFMITAYTHTGRKTSTGIWPKVGTIAVDPKIIPYGTYIYVPGYGIGKAADTGVSGKHIDLFFDTYEECIEYGRKRDVKIYILEKPVTAD